jgi:hypothetical protein
MMLRGCTGVCLLWLCMSARALAQDPLDQLLKSLEGIAWPFDYAVLSSLEDTQDFQKRIGALTEILDDREAIHSRADIDAFQGTQIVCSALLLLDTYDLPDVDRIINRLGEEENWESRERALLAYVSAKRGIRYDTNVSYLLEALRSYETNLEDPANAEVAWAVRDICDTLSYLGDLFIVRGDARVLDGLFAYASIAFGYPAEYFSDRLTGMLLKRPTLFVSSLARSTDETRMDVTNSIGFGIRNDSIRKSLDNVLNDELGRVEGREKEVVVKLKIEVEALRRQWSRETEAERSP